MNSKTKMLVATAILLIILSTSSALAHQSLPNGRLYYTTNISGNYDIYYQDGDAQPVQLTTDSRHNHEFNISPEGDYIVYDSYPGEMTIMNLEEGESSSRPVQQGSYIVNGKFSPDGHDIVFVKGTTTTADIYIIPKTANPTDIATPVTLNDCSGDIHPNWSPDGEMVVFGGTLPGVCSYYWQDLYLTIINRDGSNRRTIYDAQGDPILANHSFIWKNGDNGENKIIFGVGQNNPACCHQKLIMVTFTLPDDPLSTEPVLATTRTIFESFPPNRGFSTGDWDDQGNIWFTWTNAEYLSKICTISEDGIQNPVCEFYNFRILYIAPVVINNPPVIDPIQPASGNEGEQLNLLAVVSDPENDPLSYNWDYSLGDGVDPGTICTFSDPYLSETAFSCTDNGSFNVTITSSDNNNDPVSESVTITIDNLPPDIETIIAPITPLPVGTTIETSALFTDPGSNDTHTATWDWGDSTNSEGEISNNLVTGEHTYNTPDVYTLVISVEDDDTGLDIEEFLYVVVYDPEGGFVTGGGWFNSPEGAFYQDPLLTGKATFGFVSKYKKGANIPTGNTEFQFKVANLSFKSASYDWLVIAGKKAIFKGVGTINGEGQYRFILSVIDVDLNVGDGLDKFRIKIWDLATDEMIYDNQLGEIEDSDPVTELEGGSIVIHKK